MANNNIEEEVTITPIIKDLERLFNRLLQFIVSIFSGLFNGLTALLKFCFKNFLFLFIFSVIGLILGFYSTTLVEPTYSSDLILELNIDASSQLTADVNYFNSLIENDQFESLSKVLQINELEAKSLKEMSISGSSSYTDKVSAISSFYKKLDTNLQKEIKFDELLNSELTDFDNRFTITLSSNEKNVFSKIESQLIVFFERVPELQKIRKNTKKNLIYKKEVYLKEMNRLDTLKNVLDNVMIEQAKSKSEGSTTNISLNQTSDKNDFQLLEIYNRYLYYSQEVITLDKLINNIDNCYQIHSHFSNFGVKSGLKRSGNILVFGLSFFLLSILVLLLKDYRKNPTLVDA